MGKVKYMCMIGFAMESAKGAAGYFSGSRRTRGAGIGLIASAACVAVVIIWSGVSHAQLDPEISANPALARLAIVEPELASSILRDAKVALRATPREVTRGMCQVPRKDMALIMENPIFRDLCGHDPTEAMRLIDRLRQAGEAKP